MCAKGRPCLSCFSKKNLNPTPFPSNLEAKFGFKSLSFKLMLLDTFSNVEKCRKHSDKHCDLGTEGHRIGDQRLEVKFIWENRAEILK